MSTRTLFSTVARVAFSAGCVVTTASCGGELLRTGRSAMMLTLISMEAKAGGGQFGSYLLSDVQRLENNVPTIVNDVVTAHIRIDEKNVNAVATPLNAVTLTRYRVQFIRADGRNTPGVDVPYGFDGALAVGGNPGNLLDAQFVMVRHQAKLEPPLRNLVGLGGQIFFSTIAQVTFYGHDNNSNELSVVGRMDVHFGDFADQ